MIELPVDWIFDDYPYFTGSGSLPPSEHIFKVYQDELDGAVKEGTTSIDWTVKESVKAKLRSIVKRILRKHSYPPDKQEKPSKPCSNKPSSSARTLQPREAIASKTRLTANWSQRPNSRSRFSGRRRRKSRISEIYDRLS